MNGLVLRLRFNNGFGARDKNLVMGLVLRLGFGDGFGTQVKIRSRFTKNGARSGPWPQSSLQIIQGSCDWSLRLTAQDPQTPVCSWMISLSIWEQPREAEARALSFFAIWSRRLSITEANINLGCLRVQLRGDAALSSEFPSRSIINPAQAITTLLGYHTVPGVGILPRDRYRTDVSVPKSTGNMFCNALRQHP